MGDKEVKEHVKQILERAKATEERRRARRDEIARSTPVTGRAPAGRKILVAEGDSWFAYPGTDVLEELEEIHGYKVISVAHAGDTIESMAYHERQLDTLNFKLGKLAARGKKPTAILLSGGGNDIAGKEFELLLNHSRSGLSTLNEDIILGFIDVRLKTACAELISTVGELCEKHFNQRDLPAVIHGYGYSVPDGRGFWGGWGPLPGPWLEPGFKKKGYGDLSINISTVEVLIDRFNDMLQTLSQEPGFQHLHYVDLRSVLSNNLADYREYWANELHPEDEAFARVADKIQETLVTL